MKRRPHPSRRSWWGRGVVDGLPRRLRLLAMARGGDTRDSIGPPSAVRALPPNQTLSVSSCLRVNQAVTRPSAHRGSCGARHRLPRHCAPRNDEWRRRIPPHPSLRRPGPDPGPRCSSGAVLQEAGPRLGGRGDVQVVARTARISGARWATLADTTPRPRTCQPPPDSRQAPQAQAARERALRCPAPASLAARRG